MLVQGCAATPNYLLSALAEHGKKAGLKDVELMHIPTMGPATYSQPEYDGKTRTNLFHTVFYNAG